MELQSVPESDRTDEDITELPELSEEELRQLDDEAVKYTLTMQEEELSRLKPDLGALAEYRKKVRAGTGGTGRAGRGSTELGGDAKGTLQA